jgi:hypothetical protein
MQQSEVTIDEQVRPFLTEWAKGSAKYTDNHQENMAVMEAMNNYELGRKARSMSVQEALKFALELANM